jgi:hypothetical protein
MRVLHISDNPLSAAPVRLSQIQNLCGLEARLISREDYTNDGRRKRVYPSDLFAAAPEETLRPILEATDIVHYHQHWKDAEVFDVHPWSRDLLKDKPSLIQFHLPRSEHNKEVLQDSRVIKLVIAQYHVRMYPECIPVQNAVPIDDNWHRPLNIYNEPPIVGFTPPDCKADSWWDKGCKGTKRVLASGFSHRIVTDRSWRESMEVRQRCDIAIDEVVTGGYHMCSLEALSQGLATVAGLDETTVDAIEMVTGTRQHPWVVATPDTLHRRLSELVADRAYLRAKREEARNFMVRYWHPEVLVEKFRKIYALVLERHS